MKAAEKNLAQKRLCALELAEKLGNVSQACRRLGVSRTQFYEYRRRYQAHGQEGLKDRPPIHKSHPQTTPPEVVRKILDLALAHPSHGCNRLSDHLQLTGVAVSAVVIQKILNKHLLGTRYERLLALEGKILGGQIKPSPEQVAALEKGNPCFREIQAESTAPGELLCQDTFRIGISERNRFIHMQAVVDTYGSYAFGNLHTLNHPGHPAAILNYDVLPQYEAWGLKVGAILTDSGREYRRASYQWFINRHNLDHQITMVRHPQTNGFLERFHRTVKEEFFRQKAYSKGGPCQADLDEWLKYYNYKRPHQGYRNMGKRPIDTVTPFLSHVREED